MNGNGSAQLGEVEYADLVARVRASIAAVVPPNASVLVIGKGDPALLNLSGVSAAHFPQDGAGGYAGHHPHDSGAAIAEIEELRRHGADHLVIPATARWWLDHYDDFARHLATHGDLIADDPDSCLIYRLGKEGRSAAVMSVPATPRGSMEQMRDFLENLIAADAELAVLEANDGIAPALTPLHAVSIQGGDADSESLLARLRLLAAAGAEYLVVPKAEDDLLDRHPELNASIEASCRKVADQRHLCRVFALEGLGKAGG
jgi:hypothetical protein